MTKPSTLILALSGACLLSTTVSFADTITAPMVPSALVTQSLGLPTGSNGGGDNFTSFSLAFPGNALAGAMSAATSASAGNDPSVTASASFLGAPGPYSAGSIYADSELVYYVEVAGPSGGPVPVQLGASGQARSTDKNVTAYASLGVVELAGVGNDSIYSIEACGSNYSNYGCTNAQQFAVSTTLQLKPNQLYEVVIEASIASGSFYGPLATGAFSANAVVDPTLQLAPNVSDRYHIVTSANLAQTPEPNGLILTATGAFILVAVLRINLYDRSARRC